jgi:hypothetical protein
MKKHYFVSIVAILCFAFIHAYTAQGQITKEGIKIRLFTKNDKGKSSEIKDISSILGSGSRYESGLICCAGVDGKFDRIELYGNETITVMVREGSASENGDIVYLNKGYYLDKKAIFKPFEGREEFSRWTIYIMKEDKVILQFEYEFLSCT